MLKRIVQFFQWINASEIRIAIFTLLGTACILVFLTYFYDPNITFSWVPALGLYNKPEFWENVLVESHGMLLDLTIIGVFIFWLQKRSVDAREKRHLIERYQEELEDFRGWSETEAGFRVAGIISRLLKEGIEEIDYNELNLSRCSKEIIENAVEQKAHIISLEGAELAGANLKGGNFEGCNLQNANLKGANLQNARLDWANMQFANLSEGNLEGAMMNSVNLKRSNLSMTCFKRAYLNNANFHSAYLPYSDFEQSYLLGALLHESAGQNIPTQ